MKAVIMAGGFGTRIHPLTINQPKPMIPLINRPIMEHIIRLLKHHGITKLVLLLYHQPEVIKKYFGDGSEFGVHITYVVPLEDFGTAGAVKAAARHLGERFIIISGDLLTDFDLSRAIAFHEQKQAEATLTLTPVADPLQFGVVITDNHGRITKFLEKPGWGEVFSDTINTGIYVLEPSVLDLIPDGENRDWAKDIFPEMLSRQAPLFGCILEGYWADIGNTDAYMEACGDIFAEKVSIQIAEPAQSAGGKLFISRDARVDQGVELNGMVILGDNTRVIGNSRLTNCSIGRNCRIEDGAVLENTILWDNVYVKSGAQINGATICQSVRIGQDAQIESGAVIGDETTIGDEAHIRPDVKIWPRKVVESGSTVTGNLIWGEKWRKSLFEGAVVRGLTNIELTPEFAAKLGAAYGSTLPKGSFVLAGRDAIRSSRMLKRSFVGGLLSTGVNVRDIKMVSLPVLRYKLTTFGEVGGVHFRQSPEDSAGTEIIFFGEDGNEFSSALGKNLERIFFKENFRRAHHAEPGFIEELPQIYDFYRDGYLRNINREALKRRAPRLVLDLNHSPAASLLPELLTDLGFELTELNSHLHEKGVLQSEEEQQRALDKLSRIVMTLDADAGFWLGPSGEKVRIVSSAGRILNDLEALNVLTVLVTRAEPTGVILTPVAAPNTVDLSVRGTGMTIRRTRADGRSLVEAGRDRQARLVASLDGRFGFPLFQAHFDGLYAIAKVMEMSATAGLSLDEALSQVPDTTYHHVQIPCSWEYKGGLMRRMSEAAVDQEASFVDGVRIDTERGWVLVLPDPYRPVAHLFCEARDQAAADQLRDSYQAKIKGWLEEMAGSQTG